MKKNSLMFNDSTGMTMDTVFEPVRYFLKKRKQRKKHVLLKKLSMTALLSAR